MNATNWKLGVSTPRCDEDVFKGFSEAGIDCMEVSILAASAIPDWKNIEKLSKQYGVDLWSYHLPFYPFEVINIATLDSELREGTIELLIDRVKRAADVGVKNMVIHPSGEPNDDSVRPELMKSAKYCLDKLAEAAAKEGAIIPMSADEGNGWGCPKHLKIDIYRGTNAVDFYEDDGESGKYDLVDPEGKFNKKDALMVVESDDFITMQLVINAILRNDFKAWKNVKWDDGDSLKAILVKLGYSRDEIVELLKEF